MTGEECARVRLRRGLAAAASLVVGLPAALARCAVLSVRLIVVDLERMADDLEGDRAPPFHQPDPGVLQ